MHRQTNWQFTLLSPCHCQLQDHVYHQHRKISACIAASLDHQLACAVVGVCRCQGAERGFMPPGRRVVVGIEPHFTVDIRHGEQISLLVILERNGPSQR